MSHFVVGVISKERPDDSYIERILEPYYEGKEVRHIISKEEIINRTRKEIEDFQNGTYKEYLENPEEYISKYGNNKRHIEYLTKEFPPKLSWTDEQCYQDGIKWYDESSVLPNGDVVSTYNPLSKWDWYEIGGRWGGYIKTNEGDSNKAKIKNITNLFDVKKANEARIFWDIYVDGKEPITEYEREIAEKPHLYSKDYYIKYYQNVDNFVDCQATFSTYAFIDEFGEWHEKGSMGWWGISDQTDDAEEVWVKKFKEYLTDDSRKDYWLTIVDCHI